MEIRFHLDEHMDPAIAAGLRRRGVDVTTTVAEGLAAASDLEQLTYAAGRERVLVTRDTDFLVLSGEGMPHAGSAFWPSRHRSLGQLILDLTLLWRIYTAEEMAGRVEYL